MTASRSVHSTAPAWRAILLVCVVLAAYHVWGLPGAWTAWHRGVADEYAGQHRGLLLGHVTGLALALAIPLPGLIGVAGKWSRGRRVALWGTWGVLMAVVVAGLALDVAK